MRYFAFVLAIAALILILSPLFVFIVDEREMAVVLRFGNPKHAYTAPGLYTKMPFVDSVQRISKYKQFWGDTKQNLLPDLPTKDDKKIELIPWAVWRVSDPTVFVQRLRTMEVAEERVFQIVRSSIRDVITQYDLEEIVRSTNRELSISESSPSMTVQAIPDGVPAELIEQATNSKPKNINFGRAEILERIKVEAIKRLSASGSDLESAGRGIELIDVGISQIGFVDSVRRKTFDRWVAERQSISAKNINEGERLKAAIVNQAKAEVAKIEGEGQQRSNELRGTTDAEVIRIFAAAIEETGDFYTFARTIQAYETALGPDSKLILSTDSPFFNVFKDLSESKP